MSGSLTKEDLTEAMEPIMEKLFDPDKGLYARVERNTVWRRIHMWLYMTIFSALVVVGAGIIF